jgi:hypothetical protein
MNRLKLIVTALMVLAAWLALPTAASAAFTAQPSDDGTVVGVPAAGIPAVTFEGPDWNSVIAGIESEDSAGNPESLAEFGQAPRALPFGRAVDFYHWSGRPADWEYTERIWLEMEYRHSNVAVGLPMSVTLLASGLVALALLRRRRPMFPIAQAAT